MKFYITFIIFLYWLPLSTKGQLPQPAISSFQVIGGEKSDNVNSLVTTTVDGGFIMSFQTSSTSGPIDTYCTAPYTRTIFQKYNGDASTVEWVRCLPTSGDSSFLYMFSVSDGNYVLGGMNYNAGKFRIRKEDPLGNTIWSKAYGGSNTQTLRSMISTNDGGYILVGESYANDGDVGIHYGDAFSADIWALKIDSIGNKVWSKVIGGTGVEQVASVVVGPNGGCYILGATYSTDYDCTGNHGEKDVFLVRLDNSGNIIWHKDFGGTNTDMGKGGTPDGKGGIVFVARSSSSDGDVPPISTGLAIVWLVIVDSNSNIVTSKCYGGGSADCYPNSVCRSTDGSIWIAGVSMRKFGEIDTAFGGEDAWFVHVDSVGGFLSEKVLGSTKDDRGTMIYPLVNGSVVGGGFYDAGDGLFPNIFFGDHDAFLIQFAAWTTRDKTISKLSDRMMVYPNPARDFVNLLLPVGIGSNCRITICDVLGRDVYRENYIGNNRPISIPVRDLQRGIYQIEVNDEVGFRDVQKVVLR